MAISILTGELSTCSWFGAWAAAAHISLRFCVTQHSGLRRRSWACYWYHGDISILPCLFWRSCLSSFAYITLGVMDRRPGGSWYGKLDILWLVKGDFFYDYYWYYRPPLFMSLMQTFEAGSAVFVSWGTSFRLRWWTVGTGFFAPLPCCVTAEGQVRDPMCPSSACWDQFLSVTAATVLHLTVLLSCDNFLPFLWFFFLSLFSTHMAQ